MAPVANGGTVRNRSHALYRRFHPNLREQSSMLNNQNAAAVNRKYSHIDAAQSNTSLRHHAGCPTTVSFGDNRHLRRASGP